MIILESFKDAAAIKLVIESNYIKRKSLQKVWHRTDAAIRFFILSVLSCLFIGNCVINFVILSLIWWVLFDSILNKLTGKDILYVGYTSDIDIFMRKTANFIKANPEKFMIKTKVILLIAAITIKLWGNFLIKN